MAEITEKAQQVGMTWEEVCADPNLQDLPYKIELNEWGQIVMSPTSLRHGAHQFKIGEILSELTGRQGHIVTECAIRTSKGTKVADVAWFSATRWEQVSEEFDSSIAPEICVEVLSPRNAAGEIEQKQKLYFEAGAGEVWICDKQGRMAFYDRSGRLTRSALVPNFPGEVRA
jgi:Uma2 family endonuclease